MDIKRLKMTKSESNWLVKLDFNMEAKDDRIVKLEDQIHTTGDYMKAIIEDSDTELDKDFLLECGLECLQNSGDVNA